MKDGYITVGRLAFKTKIKKARLYNWAKKGKIPSIRIGRLVYVKDLPKSDLYKMKKCVGCGTEFKTLLEKQKYCSKACGSKHRYEVRKGGGK